VLAVVRAASQARRERKVGTRKVHFVRGTTVKKRLRRRPRDRRAVRAGQGVWCVFWPTHWARESMCPREEGERVGRK
jgi:hypothetical protein